MRSRHATWFILGAGLVAWAVIIARAAQSPAAYMPIVAVEATPTATPPATSLVVLVASDSTFVSAVNVPNTSRVLIAYIDRAHSNRLHLVEDMGDHVVEVPYPVLEKVSPSFVFPGPKQGDSSMLIIGSSLRIYFTGRDDGDPTGPFKLKRLTMPVPAAP